MNQFGKLGRASFFDYLDFLRAFFAGIVFLYHLSYPRNGYHLNGLYQLEWGHYAVAGFFFISGFFMAHLLRSDLKSSEFIKNRLLRIYSVLIPCLFTDEGIGGIWQRALDKVTPRIREGF